MPIVEFATGSFIRSEYDSLIKFAHEYKKPQYRRVRTPAGAKVYGQPIGSIITKNMLKPHIKSFAQMAEFGEGSRVEFTGEKSGKKYIYTKMPNGQWKNNQSGVIGEPSAFVDAIKTNNLTVDHIAGEEEHLPAAPNGFKSDVEDIPSSAAGSSKVSSVADLDSAPVGSTMDSVINGNKVSYVKEQDGEWHSEISGNAYESAVFKKYLDHIDLHTPNNDETESSAENDEVDDSKVKIPNDDFSDVNDIEISKDKYESDNESPVESKESGTKKVEEEDKKSNEIASDKKLTSQEQIDDLPDGTIIEHGQDEFQYKKDNGNWYYAEDGKIQPGDPIEDSFIYQDALNHNGGMFIKEMGKDRSNKIDVSVESEKNDSKDLLLNGESFKLKGDDEIYQSPNNSIVYVNHKDGSWTLYSPSLGITPVFVHQMSDDQTPYLYSLKDTELVPYGTKKTPVIKPPVEPVKLIEGANKNIHFQVGDTSYSVPGDSKVYSLPDGSSNTKYAKSADGTWINFQSNGISNETPQAGIVLDTLVKDGKLTPDVTSSNSPDVKLHPTGLKPGIYSKGPTAKVSMHLGEDGSSVYVDKNGNAKKLTASATLKMYNDGFTYFQGHDNSAIPVPGSVSQDISFEANGKTVVVPAGSKIYQLNVNGGEYHNTSKYILKSDGSWDTISAGTEWNIQSSDQDYSGLVKSGMLVPSTDVKIAEPSKKITKVKSDAKIQKFMDGVYPFSSPPDLYNANTSKLKSTIASMAADTGFKTSAGKYRTQMNDKEKAAWIRHWYNGSWDKAFQIELTQAAKEDLSTRIKDLSELENASPGTKVVSFESYSSADSYIYIKQDDGLWAQENTGITTPVSTFESAVKWGRVAFLNKAVHSTAAKHPGSPEYPANAGGFKKLNFGAAVEGEIPAGSKVSGPNILDNPKDQFGPSPYHYSPSDVDAYMLAANMVNSHSLTQVQKQNWVKFHVYGDKIATDRLSLNAKIAADKGQFLSEIIVPQLPIMGAGQSVDVFDGDTSFNIGASHANNLKPAQVDDYISRLFTPKAAAIVKQQPEYVKRAIVQLHWLTVAPRVKGAYKNHAQATEEYNALIKNIEDQVLNKSQYGQSTNFTLEGLNFPKKAVWAKAPKAIQPNYNGAFEKYDIIDDAGNVLFFKPAKSDWRAQAADGANHIGKFFGFKTPASQLLRVDDVYGQAQAKVSNSGTAKNFKPEDLSAKQFTDVLKEHLLDWAMDQDDSHSGQFLLNVDGGITGIDKDRIFSSLSSGHVNKLQRGKLSTNPQVMEKVYYEDMYNSIVNGHINHGQVQKAYLDVMARARSMQAKPDDQYRKLVGQVFEKNPKLSEAQKNKLIKDAVERKNSLVDDFQKFWDGIFKDSGIEVPEPSKLSEAPGLHAGFSPEFIASVKQSRNWGHSTFFASQDLEDGHLIVQEINMKNGDGKILAGQGLLLKSGDQKFVNWLSNNYTGPNAPTETNAEKFAGQEELDSTILDGIKTIRKNLSSGNFNQVKLDKMTTILGNLKNIENDDDYWEDRYPGDEHKLAGHKEMVASYIKQIEDALQAKEVLQKPNLFVSYKYSSPDSAIKLKSDYPVTVRNSILHLSNLEPTTNLLTDTGKTTTTGQSGLEYVVDLGDGLELSYRPWSSPNVDTNLSQQGQLRFRKENYNDDHSYGDRVMDFLREVGIEADDTTDEDLELQYWRTLYGIMSHRSDFNSGKQANVKQAVEADDPRNSDNKSDELAKWRDAWSLYAGQPVVDNFIEKKGFLPKFDKVLPQDNENGHGRPHWNRFDVDLDQFRLKHGLLVRSQKGLGGNSSLDADNKVILALRTGGPLPVEERAHVLGIWNPGSSGGSGDQDSLAGSGSFTMARQNIDTTTNAYHFYFDPEILTRIHTYTYSSDHFGKISLKAFKSYFDMDKQSGFKSDGNEVVAKSNMSILSSLKVAVFQQESKRQEAIKQYKDLGVNEINGVPLEDVFVLSQNRQNAVASAKKTMRSQIVGSGSYQPDQAPGEFIDPGKVEKTLTDLPVGSVIGVSGMGNYKKEENLKWNEEESDDGYGAWSSGHHIFLDNNVKVISSPEQAVVEKELKSEKYIPAHEAVNTLKELPIDSEVQWKFGTHTSDATVYKKIGIDEWVNVNGPPESVPLYVGLENVADVYVKVNKIGPESKSEDEFIEHVKSDLVDSSLPHDTPADLDKLPVGSILQSKKNGTLLIKDADGDWQKGQGTKYSSSLFGGAGISNNFNLQVPKTTENVKLSNIVWKKNIKCLL